MSALQKGARKLPATNTSSFPVMHSRVHISMQGKVVTLFCRFGFENTGCYISEARKFEEVKHEYLAEHPCTVGKGKKAEYGQ